MIDWVTASIPLNWTSPISGGMLQRISPDGEVERETVLSAHVRGSDDEHLTLRTVQRGFVEFDGNPSKFLQCHNLCGSDDLRGLVVAALAKALGILGVPFTDDDRHHVQAGHWKLSRVDVTQMFELPSRADCRAWLRSASELGRMRWRNSSFTQGTWYWGKVEKGKRASPWSLKGYVKADEIEARGKSHRLPENLPFRDELIAWVDNKLRFEVLLRTAELKRYAGGRYLDAFRWDQETSAKLFNAYFSKLQLGTNAMLHEETLETLKPAMRLAYNAWKDGHDLSGILPHKTLYRYRAKLLEMTNGEIDLKVPPQKASNNVVPLVRILEMKPAPDPEFLRDRPDLLFRSAA